MSRHNARHRHNSRTSPPPLIAVYSKYAWVYRQNKRERCSYINSYTLLVILIVIDIDLAEVLHAQCLQSTTSHVTAQLEPISRPPTLSYFIKPNTDTLSNILSWKKATCSRGNKLKLHFSHVNTDTQTYTRGLWPVLESLCGRCGNKGLDTHWEWEWVHMCMYHAKCENTSVWVTLNWNSLWIQTLHFGYTNKQITALKQHKRLVQTYHHATTGTAEVQRLFHIPLFCYSVFHVSKAPCTYSGTHCIYDGNCMWASHLSKSASLPGTNTALNVALSASTMQPPLPWSPTVVSRWLP